MKLSQRNSDVILYISLVFAVMSSVVWNIIFKADKGDWFFRDTPSLAKEFGFSDQGSYLRAALDLQDFVLDPNNYWVLQLWPPGTPVLSALLDLLPGTLLPYLVAVVSALWAIPLYLMIVSNRGSFITILVSFIAWLINPIFNNWLLGSGFFTSDSIGVPLLAAGLSLLLFSLTERGSRKSLALAGVLVGLSLYFRATFLPLTLLAISTFLAIIGILFLIRLTRHGESSLRERISQAFNSKDIQSSVVRFLHFALPLASVALPWAVLVFFIVNPGSVSWSANEYLWLQKWTSSEDLISGGGGFQVDGGLNWPCVVDPATCAAIQNEISAGGRGEMNIAREAAFATIASNFGSFIFMRTENILEAFPSLPGSPIGQDVGFETSTGYIAFVLFYLLALLTFRRDAGARKFTVSLVFVLAALVVLANFAVLALYTIETRYFFPGHLVTLLAAGFFATVWRENRKNHPKATF